MAKSTRITFSKTHGPSKSTPYRHADVHRQHSDSGSNPKTGHTSPQSPGYGGTSAKIPVKKG
jgi:hypothetical protein